MAADKFVVALEDSAPGSIAECGRLLARTDDVTKKDGSQKTVRLGWLLRLPGSGEELFDLLQDRLGITGGDHVVDAGELHVARARDVFGEVAGSFHVDRILPGPVHHEGRCRDRRQDVPHVDLHVHPFQGLDVPWTCTLSPRSRQRELRLPVAVRCIGLHHFHHQLQVVPPPQGVIKVVLQLVLA